MHVDALCQANPSMVQSTIWICERGTAELVGMITKEIMCHDDLHPQMYNSLQILSSGVETTNLIQSETIFGVTKLDTRQSQRSSPLLEVRFGYNIKDFKLGEKT